MKRLSAKQRVKMHSLVRTLSLEDRIEIASQLEVRRLPGRSAARARRVISRWKRRTPFTGNGFSAWLASIGLDERKLEQLLTIGRSSRLRARVSSHLQQSLATLRDAALDGECVPRHGHEALLHLVQPLVASTITEIRADLEALCERCAGRFFDVEHALGLCRRDLANLAVYLIQKTCLQELQIAGLRKTLDGANGAQRYRSFIDAIGKPAGREALFLEYPLLLDAVVVRLRMYRRNVAGLLTALIQDADAIEHELLDGTILGSIKDWKFGSGDSHCGGRSVTLLTFADETRLVYKPRSMRIDVGFNALLAWCNEQLPSLPLRGVRTLDRGDHGWCEFVAHRELPSQDAAGDFFHRQGKFLALFYALHTSDLHHENMIACGADPIYIDLETLFHTQLFPPTADGSWSDAWPMTVAGTLIISNTRAVPGMKPSSPDLTVFGARPDQGVNLRILKLAHAGTDCAGFEERDVAFEERSHLAVFDSEWLPAERYANEIRSGFIEMHRMLAGQVRFLTSSDGVPRFFHGAQTRLVFRPTQVYGTLIDTALHPDYLGDALERRVFFEQLYLANAQERWRNQLMPSEIADMEQLDVPHFVQGFADSRVLDSRGRVVPGLHLPSPLEVVSKHLSLLDESDLRAQLRLIDDTLRARDESAAASLPDVRDVVRAQSESATEFAARIAGEIADRLLATMVARGKDRYWLCRAMAEDGSLTNAPSILNLYDGQLGIAVFLAEAARVLHREDCADAALAATRTVRRWTHEGRCHFPFVGVFGGALGLPYALARIGDAVGDDEAFAVSMELLAAFDPERSTKGGFDIVDGAAGGVIFLGSMLRRLDQRGSSCGAVKALMEYFADQLVKNAIAQRKGVGWTPRTPQNPLPLTGFAHGNAGYAASLYIAAQHLHKPVYGEFARAAIAYENSCYSPHEHWIDLRERSAMDQPDARKRMCAWCSGSAGVLLGRLLCLNASDPQGSERGVLVEDARRAARIAWSEHDLSSANNLSLCHGALGNLDILGLAARHPALGEIVPEKARREWLLGDREWRCGDDFCSPLRAPGATPGLMTGLAGIGLGLLQQVSPAVPSVLTLDVF